MIRLTIALAMLASSASLIPSTAFAAPSAESKKSATKSSRPSTKTLLPSAAATPLAEALGRSLIDEAIPYQEIQDFVSARIPPMPVVHSADEWEKYAERVRREVLDRVVFRGEAKQWRSLPLNVKWQKTIDGGPGYKITKLCYEAVPGLWIPALLYEPTDLKGRVPVSLAVNGHDSQGKSVPYKQLRCINQAKRGMIVLNTEFLGMGQLKGKNYDHYRMNQLDLCGTSGLAPFYLVMSRGLDILLSHKHADPSRVAVQGLSGGGWQTITISALDTRVTLCNPVAGYSALRTRVQNGSDLGDSEQNPVDLEVFTDYLQMTGMLAPRPALLTYNVADDCCFKADHALPPLKAAARPIYALYGKPHNLGSYVNHNPGTHNYDLDNRQQFYGFLKQFFFADRADVTAIEIPSQAEVKTADQLAVDLPAGNADFNTLARQLLPPLPRDPSLPTSQGDAVQWQKERRKELGDLVHAHSWDLVHVTIAARNVGPNSERDRWLRIGTHWTLPSVEFTPPNPKGDAIVLADGGRAATSAVVEELLSAGRRVLTVDLYDFGESKHAHRPSLFAIAVSSVGERPLGIQSSQLMAIARWQHKKVGNAPLIVTIGPRSGLIATVAAALETEAISGVELRGGFGSLKEIVEKNLNVEKAPELFCFGLLERFDMPQLAALVAPRPIRFPGAGARAQAESARIGKVYAAFGADFDPTR